MAARPLANSLLFVIVAVCACAADLGSKSWIFNWLGSPGQPEKTGNYSLIQDHFSLTTSLNEGALFGIGQGGAKWFAGLSVVAAFGILYWLIVADAAQDRLLTVALGLVMGGIFGNLYDRLGLPGLVWYGPADRVGQPVYAVRDFLYFRTINFPIFNIADSCLVIGAGLLFIHAFFFGKDEKTGDSGDSAKENAQTSA